MLTAQATDIWFTANPKDWSRDSAVRSLRLTDWPTTQQDLQLPWLNITCREAKSFSKNHTSKTIRRKHFHLRFSFKNCQSKIFHPITCRRQHFILQMQDAGLCIRKGWGEGGKQITPHHSTCHRGGSASGWWCWWKIHFAAIQSGGEKRNGNYNYSGWGV